MPGKTRVATGKIRVVVVDHHALLVERLVRLLGDNWSQAWERRASRRGSSDQIRPPASSMEVGSSAKGFGYSAAVPFSEAAALARGTARP
jgi:hypothetical protein